MQSGFAFAFFLLAMATCPVSSLRRGNRNRMQPQVVAHTLFQMEDEWRNQAELFAECNASTGSAASCSAATKAFEKSCATVVSAVQQASSGDRSTVTEYMGDICGQAVLQGWRQDRCQSLASTITGAMTADSYENRLSLDVLNVCQSYWSSFAAAETARVGRERAEAEAKRVQHEAEEKQLADERAATAKKAAEKAAQQEDQRKAEEVARKAADAKKETEKQAVELKAKEEKEAADLKTKAEKEAAELKATEELALRKAEEAKQKMDEAKAAAQEAREKREATVAKLSSNVTAAKVNSNATAATRK